MPSITETIRQLRSMHARALPGGIAEASSGRPSRLKRLAEFGSNPGGLNGWYHVPSASAPSALVVVLHGCTQTAAGYDHGSGWSDMGERFGFAVLFPEQQRSNNPNLCFNWFQDEDTRRGGGEALSIRQMIGATIERYPIDTDRVFVTGLSAGGAMANVMLATYPELFAGGSIIAGLPYGSASSVPQALERMRGNGHPSAGAYADRVRRASPNREQWPRVTVWHGDADRTVVHANAEAILGQWRGVHGLRDAPDRVDTVDGQQHRAWLADDGSVSVEEYRIAGLGHGTPLATRGPGGCGHAGAFMLDAGISSTWRQAESWGMIDRSLSAAPPPPAAPSTAGRPSATADPAMGVAATIERALRSAGLMR